MKIWIFNIHTGKAMSEKMNKKHALYKLPIKKKYRYPGEFNPDHAEVRTAINAFFEAGGTKTTLETPSPPVHNPAWPLNQNNRRPGGKYDF